MALAASHPTGTDRAGDSNPSPARPDQRARGHRGRSFPAFSRRAFLTAVPAAGAGLLQAARAIGQPAAPDGAAADPDSRRRRYRQILESVFPQAIRDRVSFVNTAWLEKYEVALRTKDRPATSVYMPGTERMFVKVVDLPRERMEFAEFLELAKDRADLRWWARAAGAAFHEKYHFANHQDPVLTRAGLAWRSELKKDWRCQGLPFLRYVLFLSSEQLTAVSDSRQPPVVFFRNLADSIAGLAQYKSSDRPSEEAVANLVEYFADDAVADEPFRWLARNNPLRGDRLEPLLEIPAGARPLHFWVQAFIAALTPSQYERLVDWVRQIAAPELFEPQPLLAAIRQRRREVEETAAPEAGPQCPRRRNGTGG